MRIVLISIFCCSLVFPQSDSLHKTSIIGSFNQALFFTVDQADNLIVYDDGSKTLLKLTPGGDTITSIGGYGWKTSAFDTPLDGIAKNGLDVFISDYGNSRILRLDKNLNFLSSYPATENDPAEKEKFRYPRSIDTDRFGKLYLVNGENNTILKINNDVIERAFGGVDAGAGRLLNPVRVRISKDDKVFVQDRYNIVVFDLIGNYLQTIGNGLFKSLKSFCLDRNYVYALDSCNICIFQTSGKKEIDIPLSEIDEDLGCSDIIDLFRKDSTIYFLTSHSVFMKTFKQSGLLKME